MRGELYNDNDEDNNSITVYIRHTLQKWTVGYTTEIKYRLTSRLTLFYFTKWFSCDVYGLRVVGSDRFIEITNDSKLWYLTRPTTFCFHFFNQYFWSVYTSYQFIVVGTLRLTCKVVSSKKVQFNWKRTTHRF